MMGKSWAKSDAERMNGAAGKEKYVGSHLRVIFLLSLSF